jgi:glycosyltransferase involved in cell wall biosynthesis
MFVMRRPAPVDPPSQPSGKTGRPWTEESPQLPATMRDGNHWPQVSIVTPSYNQGQFIEDTILSVCKQDYPNLEHVVMDGGSTDDTVAILRRYDSAYDLVWVSEPDAGQSDALNKGFRLARGDIIGWLNSDDTFMPGTVPAAVGHLQDHPEKAWVYGDGYVIDEHSSVLWRIESRPFDLKRLICDYQYIVQPTVFFRRDVLDVVGFLDPSLHMTMDYDFFIRLGLRFKAGYIPRVLATRRLHSSAKTTNRPMDFGADALATLDKTFASCDLPEDVIRCRRTAYSNRYASCGSRCFGAGLYREARAQLLRALRLSPRVLRRRTAVILAIYLQSLLRARLYVPDEQRQRRFQARHGPISTIWFRDARD